MQNFGDQGQTRCAARPQQVSTNNAWVLPTRILCLAEPERRERLVTNIPRTKTYPIVRGRTNHGRSLRGNSIERSKQLRDGENSGENVEEHCASEAGTKGKGSQGSTRPRPRHLYSKQNGCAGSHSWEMMTHPVQSTSHRPPKSYPPKVVRRNTARSPWPPRQREYLAGLDLEIDGMLMDPTAFQVPRSVSCLWAWIRMGDAHTTLVSVGH